MRMVLKKSTHSKAATSTALMSRQGPLRLICFGLDPPDRGLGQGVYALSRRPAVGTGLPGGANWSHGGPELEGEQALEFPKLSP